MTEQPTDRSGEKRRRIVEAARFLVLRNGLRGTTMEAIAREAQIAKPTLYAQFADKDAVFAGIIDAMMDELLAAYDSGMAGPGDIAERIGAALAAQYIAIARALDGSPHAGELMAEHKRAGLAFREKEMRAQTEITEMLASAGVADAAVLSRVVQASAYGIAFKVTDEAEMADGIKLMCRRLIGPAITR